eukprot:10227677-Karenia_brevis.AAC.3
MPRPRKSCLLACCPRRSSSPECSKYAYVGRQRSGEARSGEKYGTATAKPLSEYFCNRRA